MAQHVCVMHQHMLLPIAICPFALTVSAMQIPVAFAMMSAWHVHGKCCMMIQLSEVLQSTLPQMYYSMVLFCTIN